MCGCYMRIVWCKPQWYSQSVNTETRFWYFHQSHPPTNTHSSLKPELILKPQILPLCQTHHLRDSISNCPKLWDGMNRQIKGFLLVGRATWSNSFIPTAVTLLSWPLLQVSAFMCHAGKSMSLIFGNNGGLYPQRRTHFSLSHKKPMIYIQVHTTYSLSIEHVPWEWLSHFEFPLYRALIQTLDGKVSLWRQTYDLVMCAILPGLREARTLLLFFGSNRTITAI